MTAVEKFITVRNESNPGAWWRPALPPSGPSLPYQRQSPQHQLSPPCVYDAQYERFFFAATLVRQDCRGACTVTWRCPRETIPWELVLFQPAPDGSSMGVQGCSDQSVCYVTTSWLPRPQQLLDECQSLYSKRLPGPSSCGVLKKAMTSGAQNPPVHSCMRGVWAWKAFSSGAAHGPRRRPLARDPSGTFFLALTYNIRRMAVIPITGTEGLDANPPVAPVAGQTVLLEMRTLQEPSPAKQNNGKTFPTLDRRLQSLNYHFSNKDGSNAACHCKHGCYFHHGDESRSGLVRGECYRIVINRPTRALQSSGIIGSSTGDTVFGSVVGPIGKRGTIAFVGSTTREHYQAIQGVISYYPSGTYAEGFTEFPSDAYLTGRAGALSTITLNEKGEAYGVATFAQTSSFQQDVANWGTVISRFTYDPEAEPPAGPPPAPPPPYLGCPALPCLDVYPASGKPCAQIAKAGECSSLPPSFCEASCNKCGSTAVPAGKQPTCADISPPNQALTCYYIFYFWKCDEDFAQGYCNYSCRRCPKEVKKAASLPACTDTLPDWSPHNCQEQHQFGKCNEAWMLDGNHCAKTCGRC
eukprot:jgi/Botrbrau1/7269/Bobra.0318s0007.1